MGKCTGVRYIDSTALPICHNRRIHSHKVFRQKAKRGKTSVGWFFGFKLHLIINHKGEILSFYFSKANTHDGNRKVIKSLTKTVSGKLYEDKGYIGKSLAESLKKEGTELITKIKKNMKSQNLSPEDKLLLRKRAIVEIVINQLKNISRIQHTRHRSEKGFMLNQLAGLAAYSFKDKKPSLKTMPGSLISPYQLAA